MKLALAIIVCVGLYAAVANPPKNSADKDDEEYQQLIEMAKKHALSLETDPSILRMLDWCKSEFVDKLFKSDFIKAFGKKRAAGKKLWDSSNSSKNKAAYNTLTEEISKLCFGDDEIPQLKQVIPSNDNGEVFICTICQRPVTLNGRHFITATKCGHLFGDSCIRKWLNLRPHKCPVCMKSGNLNDLRRLFSVNKIEVVDHKFQEERDILEEELVQSKRKLKKLEEIGISYNECQTCGEVFTRSRYQLDEHIKREHPLFPERR